MSSKPPKHIDSIEVEPAGEPVEVKGRTWITLAPTNDAIDLLYEWSPDTGEIIRTGNNHE